MLTFVVVEMGPARRVCFSEHWDMGCFKKNFKDLCVMLFQSSCLLFVGFVKIHFIRGCFSSFLVDALLPSQSLFSHFLCLRTRK